MKASPSIVIVIVNFKTANLVVDCLRSLASELVDVPGARVLVVDNASNDDSIERLAAAIEHESWHAWVHLLVAESNLGFSAGNNIGIRYALYSNCPPAYFMLLNPDTIVRPRAVSTLLGFLEANPEVGVAGSLLENADGTIDRSAHSAPTPLGELESAARLGILSRLLHKYMVSPPMRTVAHKCDWVSGASLIVRREVFEDIGGLDEGYFLYFEEVDFCTRARLAGWDIWFVPASRVVHLEGAATGIRNPAKRRPAYWYDSRRRYFVKHSGVLSLILADLLWAVGRASLVLRCIIWRRTGDLAMDPKRFALDLLGGDLHALFAGRLRQIKQGELRL